MIGKATSTPGPSIHPLSPQVRQNENAFLRKVFVVANSATLVAAACWGPIATIPALCLGNVAYNRGRAGGVSSPTQRTWVPTVLVSMGAIGAGIIGSYLGHDLGLPFGAQNYTDHLSQLLTGAGSINATDVIVGANAAMLAVAGADAAGLFGRKSA